MARPGFPLWDIATRCFHWTIVCCVPLAWWSAETQNYELHEWIGYLVIVLVVSRVLWGFVGSPHSRFADFLVGPHRVLAYLRGAASDSAGHNPLGGWSVIALLLLLLIQAVSGLFNSDDVLFSGPLYYAAADGFRDSMGTIHDIAFNVLLGLVALHIVAVLFHQFGRGEKLLQAMLRGRAADREGRAAPAPLWKALIIVVLVSLALWWGLAQAPQPTPIAW